MLYVRPARTCCVPDKRARPDQRTWSPCLPACPANHFWPTRPMHLPSFQPHSVTAHAPCLSSPPARLAPAHTCNCPRHAAHPPVLTHPGPTPQDYGDFPPAAYRLTYKAPGAPDLAKRVGQLLRCASRVLSRSGLRRHLCGGQLEQGSPPLRACPAVLCWAVLRCVTPGGLSAQHLPLPCQRATRADQGL